MSTYRELRGTNEIFVYTSAIRNFSRIKKEVLIELLFLVLVTNIQSYLGNLIFTFNIYLKF